MVNSLASHALPCEQQNHSTKISFQASMSMSRISAVPPNPAKGAVAMPSAPANAKGSGTSWEEEELAAYEPKRAKAVEDKRRADARTELLARQLPLQWKALREIIIIRCESINDKSGRLILRAVSPNLDTVEISREDTVKIDLQFDSATRKIKFTGKVLGYDREYELAVQNFNGTDTTAWYSPTTLSTEQPDDLAKLMISILLRADQ
jgi:hypothetical protein